MSTEKEIQTIQPPSSPVGSTKSIGPSGGADKANGAPEANYDGALIYAGDLEGKITKVNLTEKFTLTSEKIINQNIKTTTLFDTQGDIDNGRYIFKNMEATINNDNNL